MKNRGLIKLILLVVIALLLLSYFGISVRQVATSDTSKENFSYVWEVLKQMGTYAVDFYHQYLAKSVMWAWDNLIKTYIIQPLLGGLDKAIQ